MSSSSGTGQYGSGSRETILPLTVSNESDAHFTGRVYPAKPQTSPLCTACGVEWSPLKLASLAGVAVVVIIFITVFVALSRHSPAPPPPLRVANQVESRLGVVAADQPVCSQIGAELLGAGGSAGDAAVGTALCLGVINAFASGIGGGGFATIRDANGSVEVIDFRETAPARAFRDMFHGNATLAQVGGLSVGVPGEIRGLELIWKRHGKLPWARLFEPSIALCNNGFEVTAELAKIVAQEEKYIRGSDAFASVYVDAESGELVKEGDVIYRTKLGATLELIAANGADVFYTGSVADALVNAIQDAGGVIELGDMANYSAVIRQPLETWFLGMRVYSAPPPASGAVLNFILNVLEAFNLPKIGSMTPEVVHAIVETFKFAYALRTHLGDPCCTDIDQVMEDLTSKAHAADVRRKIVPGKTFNSSYYGSAFDMEPTPGTTHLSVVDAERNSVALTSTVNLYFGSKVMDPVTGIVLNNEMDDFSSPNVTNAFGVPPSPANFIIPGKRPLSSTTPTIVTLDDEVLAVAGASGGTKITTATVLTLFKMLAWGMDVGDAVASPRFHDQLFPDTLLMEDGFSSPLISYLRDTVGYNVDLLGPSGHIAIVQAVFNDIDRGVLTGASDWRKGGAPAAQSDPEA